MNVFLTKESHNWPLLVTGSLSGWGGGQMIGHQGKMFFFFATYTNTMLVLVRILFLVLKLYRNRRPNHYQLHDKKMQNENWCGQMKCWTNLCGIYPYEIPRCFLMLWHSHRKGKHTQKVFFLVNFQTTLLFFSVFLFSYSESNTFRVPSSST